MTVDLGDFALTGQNLAVDRIPLGLGPRRSLLDKILVDAAVESGAELREHFTVDAFLTDGDRITGVRGRDKQGTVVSERATMTVGADGRHSKLARTVRAPEYETVPSLTCWYFSYWSDMPDHGLELYQRGQRVLLAFPTSDGLTALFVAWPAQELPMVRADIERAFMSVIDDLPSLRDRVRNGRRADRFFGATDLPNFYRKPYGDGWALVGDAGCHKDPYLALGICDAFRDAELLANALDEGFRGHAPFDAALAEFERQRNESSRADYQQNIEQARFRPPPPELMRLRAALRGRQAEIDQFFRAYQGMVPRESFFNAANLQRVISTASS